MRQVNIKTLKAKLSKELLNLPLEITKNGKVIGVILEKGGHFEEKQSKEVVTSPKGMARNTEEAKEKLTAIIEKKQSTDKPKAHSSTGVGLFNPCPKPGKKQK